MRHHPSSDGSYQHGFNDNRRASAQRFESREGYGNPGYVNSNYGRSSHQSRGSDYGDFDEGSRDFHTRDFQDGRDWPTLGMSGQNFAGKGPKGYKLTDDRILEEVSQCLMQDPRVDATEIQVEVTDGEVTLTGTIESRQMKRLAEQAIDTLPGVRDVHNQLRTQGSQAGDHASRAPDGNRARSERGEKSDKNDKDGGRGESKYKVA